MALRRAGARGAVVMPEDLGDGEADDLLDHFDGLLLIGGGDLDPKTYGQPREQEVYGVIARRDGFELPLVRTAIARCMPALAICRGHQVLNVVIEGVELADHNQWVIGVQWHPEDTAGTDPVQQCLFHAFVNEVGRRSASRGR
jgi:gamma-glutamyl-gamma-aminobutyrate hydrolase PuuD